MINDDVEQKNITLTCINKIDDFIELKDEWNQLLEQSRCLSACMHWDWMNLWWKHYAKKDYELVILCFRDNDELIGIFPLVNMNVNMMGTHKVLHFMGTGEDEHEEVLTEYIDVISKPEYEEEICQLIIEFLSEEYTEWERIELYRFLKNSIIATYLINDIWLSQFKHLKYLSGYRHIIRLDRTFSEYVSKRSRSFRKNIRNYKNRLKSEGDLSFRIINKIDDIEPTLNRLIELHDQRFKHFRHNSVFKSHKFCAFHKDLMTVLLSKNQLNLGILELDNKIIAIEYNFSINRTSYAYQGGFDLKYKKSSAGFISINHMIKTAINSNKRIYDFMMNDKQSYMTSYGCSQHPVLSCCVFNSNLLNKFMYVMLLLKSFVKESIMIIKSLSRPSKD